MIGVRRRREKDGVRWSEKGLDKDRVSGQREGRSVEDGERNEPSLEAARKTQSRGWSHSSGENFLEKGRVPSQREGRIWCHNRSKWTES